MKKLFCALTIFLMIVSCNSDEHNIEELNNSFITNKRIVSQDITLEEISSYYGDEQKEIFRNLTPENRKRLWEEKFDKLLILTTNTDEKLFLDEIYDQVKEIDFSKSLEDDDIEIVQLNSLLTEGISIFKWNDVYVDITFSSFEFYEMGKTNYKAYELTKKFDDEDNGGGMGSFDDCTCRWHSLIKDCTKGGCKTTDRGCGWFLLQPCTGKFFRL